MTDTAEKSSILLIYTGGTIGMKEDPAIQALPGNLYNTMIKIDANINATTAAITTLKNAFSP